MRVPSPAASTTARHVRATIKISVALLRALEAEIPHYFNRRAVKFSAYCAYKRSLNRLAKSLRPRTIRGSMPRPLFLPTARQANWLLIIAFLSVGQALYLRYMAIENPNVELACQAGLKTWLCSAFHVSIAQIERLPDRQERNDQE